MAETTKEKKTISASENKGGKKAEKKEKIAEFKGKYTKAIGRRKRAVAQIRMYEKGEGRVIVNSMPAEDYFDDIQTGTVFQPIKLAGIKDKDFSVLVKGGGKSAQSEAIRHGLARVLVAFDEGYKLPIKAKGWLTRDPRRVERKKPGLKKARRAPQWSKR